MEPYQVVIDTNVVVSALLSRRGASFRLLSLLGSDSFQANVSVPLVLEYEDAAGRLASPGGLTRQDISDALDYMCHVANHRRIHFLWRPLLKDPKDDHVLELAVEAGCHFIITFNTRDFGGIEQFGLRAMTPREFLQLLGDIS